MGQGLAVYDPTAVLAAFDAHKAFVNACLLFALPFTFIYFLVGIRIAIRQQIYTVPYLGCALFVWHDGGFSALYYHWQDVYHWHWWLRRWEYSLMGTVALESFLIWQFIKYGRRELMPEVSPAFFGTLAVLGTLGIGTLWWLIKVTLADDLYLISFVITAAFPAIPFHTGMILRRKSRAGSSVWMQISVLLVHLSMSAIGMTVAPSFFLAPPFLTYFVAFSIWPLVNVWLILRYPRISDEEARALTLHPDVGMGLASLAE